MYLGIMSQYKSIWKEYRLKYLRLFPTPGTPIPNIVALYKGSSSLFLFSTAAQRSAPNVASPRKDQDSEYAVYPVLLGKPFKPF